MFQTLARMMNYNQSLKVKCACGHEGEFTSKDAFRLFGEDATPADIRRRMRCSACHQVGKVEAWI